MMLTSVWGGRDGDPDKGNDRLPDRHFGYLHGVETFLALLPETTDMNYEVKSHQC